MSTLIYWLVFLAVRTDPAEMAIRFGLLQSVMG